MKHHWISVVALVICVLLVIGGAWWQMPGRNHKHDDTLEEVCAWLAVLIVIAAAGVVLHGCLQGLTR